MHKQKTVYRVSFSCINGLIEQREFDDVKESLEYCEELQKKFYQYEQPRMVLLQETWECIVTTPLQRYGF